MQAFKLALSILFLTTLNFPLAAQALDYMTLQSWPQQGPWFEGWYIRVTDPQKNISFAVISTTATHENIPLFLGPTNLPGYQAFIADFDESIAPMVEEAFPKITSLKKYGSDFIFSAQNSGTLTKNRYQQKFPTGLEVIIDMKNPKPWRKDGGTPAGFAQNFPLPLNWYVYSLGSQADYEIYIPSEDRSISGTGYAHVEKNWGSAFPQAWMWLQATDPENEAHLAVAGGPLKVAGVTLTSYMVGVKIDDVDYDIRPSQLTANYQTKIDPCAGTFEIVASNLFYRIRILAGAPLSTFGLLAIPTLNGYEKNGAMESFQAEMDVEVLNHFGQVLAKKSFTRAGLEFGAANMICRN